MQGPAAGRRSSRAARRLQIMQRRVVALVIASAIIVFAIVTAYAIPTHGAVTMPQSTSAGLFGTAASQPDTQVVVARLDGTNLLLPVTRDATTAIAFHAVDSADSVALAPAGEPAGDGGSVAADGVAYYFLMDGGGTGVSSSTAGLDVGAVPGSPVLSPADGQIAAVKTYQLLGRHADVEIDVRLAADPTLLLVLTHVVASSKLHVGDQVAAGVTVMGRVRGFPAEVHQALRQFTNDAGDHVQLVVRRTAPDLAGF
jgi:hypothetical protein